MQKLNKNQYLRYSLQPVDFLYKTNIVDIEGSVLLSHNSWSYIYNLQYDNKLQFPNIKLIKHT